jgi:hypothetical protein
VATNVSSIIIISSWQIVQCFVVACGLGDICLAGKRCSIQLMMIIAQRRVSQ